MVWSARSLTCKRDGIAHNTMVDNVALYRKWRPQGFDNVVGQDLTVQTLQNAIEQNRLSHAYLFCGPRGTGKTTTARIFARAVNGNSINALDLVEIDAASNRGIEDMRALRESANYRVTKGYKVYIIDEVHQLTKIASDALLKTLEEPPERVIFILATTDPDHLKDTLLSRCQRYDFRRIGIQDMIDRLRTITDAEGIEIDKASLTLLAREATGSLRDAINLLDQIWTVYGSPIMFEATQAALDLSPDIRSYEVAYAALRQDLHAGLAHLISAQEDAIDFGRFKKQLVQHIRYALLHQTQATKILELSDVEMEQLDKLCAGTDVWQAVKALRTFSEADMSRDAYQSLPLELALAELCRTAPVTEAQPVPQQPKPQPVSQTVAQPRTESKQSTPRPAQAQSEPAPVTQQSAAPSQDMLANLRGETRRMGNGLVSAMLNNGGCTATLDGDVLTIGSSGGDVHNERLQGEVESIQKAAASLLGRDIQITFVLIKSQGMQQKAPAVKKQQSAVAQEVRGRFGATRNVK